MHRISGLRRGRARSTDSTSGRTRSRGQSMVELALVMPVVLLVILGGIDFGRVFLGWIDLHQMAHHAADYAAENPDAWSTVNPDAGAQAEYLRQIQAEAEGINCVVPATLPTPSFPSGPNGNDGLGVPVTVRVSCSFYLITPMIGAIVGNPLTVTASAAFPIRAGTITGIPTPTPSPSHTATPGPPPTPTPPPPGAARPTPDRLPHAEPLAQSNVDLGTDTDGGRNGDAEPDRQSIPDPDAVPDTGHVRRAEPRWREHQAGERPVGH